MLAIYFIIYFIINFYYFRSFSFVGKHLPDPYDGYQKVSVGDDSLNDEFRVLQQSSFKFFNLK